jgi:hypothetical protein
LITARRPAAMRGIGNDRHESRSATDLADMRASRRSARKVRTSCGNYVPLADRRGFYARSSIRQRGPGSSM